MGITSILRKLFHCSILIILASSCTTDDILPSIELSTSSNNLSEDNGTVTITATLNSKSTQNLSIPLAISGTATESSDFSLSAPAIAISSGNSSGSLIISGIQDNTIEGVETLNISLGSVENVLVLSNNPIAISVLDDDSDTDGDGVLDANDDCPDVAGDIDNNGCPFLGFLINEVLYDPPADLAGDANGDGVRDPNQDEFIEFFNSGPALDISGYTVSDESSVRHTFPPGTVVPKNGVMVLFGGGTPTGGFGGALIQIASEGQINMSNAGDIVTVRDTNGDIVVSFDIYPLSGNPDESYTRNPDLTGDFFLYDANGHNNLPDYSKVYIDLLLKYEGFSFLGEYANASATGLNTTFVDANATQILAPQQISEYLVIGDRYNFQAGYVTSKGLSFDFRYEISKPEFDANLNSLLPDANSFTFGLTKYFNNNNLKMQASITSVDNSNTNNQTVGEFLVQIVF